MKLLFKPKHQKNRTLKLFQANVKGFARGLEAEKILGATNEINQKLPSDFLVKWIGHDKPDWVARGEVNQKIPHLVIEFYEARLRFLDSGEVCDM